MSCRRRGGLEGDGDGEGRRGLWEAVVGGVAACRVGSDRARAVATGRKGKFGLGLAFGHKGGGSYRGIQAGSGPCC
jgi:hypothetical protein